MPELQAMEEVKHTAVNYFFQGLAESREETYKKIIPIAHKARDCYANTGAVTGITDEKFATMTFVDACFLVQFMDEMCHARGETFQLTSTIQPYMIGILRDILLLENQIPWPVVKFIMALRRFPTGEIVGFMASYLHGSKSKESYRIDINESCYKKPSHLLCLIRLCEFEAAAAADIKLKQGRRARFSGKVLPVSTSAAELKEMGIMLKASGTHFSAMWMIMECTIFPKIYLAPLHLDNTSACWLVNMVAFEMCVESVWTDDYPVNSYLAILSLLVDKKDDLRELRIKRIVDGLTDRQTLEFFGGLGQNLCAGQAYWYHHRPCKLQAEEVCVDSHLQAPLQ
uniref:Uncharacterized protein n=1 Tax=Arundo donax TaxID=35708 RepID=A0A0A9AMJ2_ARUDO